MSRPWRRLAVVAIALAAALSGCAVLTIDVDVYKGPLVNDPDVQIEQIAVMAIGAKPLLIQLRDRLEARHGGFPDVQAFRTQHKGKHRFDFIPDEQFFNEDRAILVNNVLSLYKDGDPRLAPFIADVLRAGRDYEVAYTTFVRTSEEDARFVQMLKPAFERGAERLKAPEVTECKPGTADLLKGLRDAYERFVQAEPGRRSAGAIEVLRIHRCLLDRKPDLVTELKRLVPNDVLGDVPDPSLDGTRLSDYPKAIPGSAWNQNSVYAAVASKGLVPLHANLLFARERSAERAAFVETIGQMLAAWPRAREALVRYWHGSLNALSVLGGSPTALSDGQRRLLGVLARAAASLVEPHLLVPALRASEASPALKRLEPALPSPPPAGRQLVLKTEARERVRESLEQELVADPAGTVAVLLRADRAVRAPDFKPPQLDARFASNEARRYGLVRIPVPIPNLENPIPPLPDDELRQLSGAIEGAGGLGAGRLSLGLETLILAYRESAHAGRVGETRRQLLDELVGFAQKVLFVANFSVLVDSEQIREDGFLLQAVGNAILTQVDEQKHAVRSAERAGARAANDNVIRQRVWEDKQGRKDEPIECGQSEAARRAVAGAAAADPEAAKRVLDCVIVELRYLHLHAVKESGADSERAKNLQAALRTALDHRSRLVQIRPAAAFLRNSYPVTSLQKQSSATWNNMLSQHALRQFGYTGDRSEAKRAIQEFDKQFWQNVNTVRVAGAGRTNYVIAKDDVGNWYVKNFSSDPEAIIKATKSLALYAAGGSVSAGAIDRANKTIEGKPESAVKPAETPPPASPVAGQLQRQEGVADKRRAALSADVRQARLGMRAAIAAEVARQAPITDDQRPLVSAALDVAAGETGCLREPAKSAPVLDDLMDLRKCRDTVLQLIDDAPIQAEITRQRTARVALAEQTAKDRKQADTAAAQAQEDATRALAAATGQASKAKADAEAADTTAANAPPDQKAEAQKRAGEARQLADVRAGEQATAALRVQRATQEAAAAAQASKDAAEAAQAARTSAGQPIPTLTPAARAAARVAVIKTFRETMAPLITELEHVIRDHQTALRTLLPN